jgi:hypothetical protein
MLKIKFYPQEIREFASIIEIIRNNANDKNGNSLHFGAENNLTISA